MGKGFRFFIITPTINRTCLKKCVDSVRKQTYKNYEHFIIFDGLPEDMTYVEQLKKYKRVSIIILPKKHDDYGNTPRCLAFDYIDESVDYVLYLDDDNYWMPDFLKELNENIKGEWGVFPIKRMGELFFSKEPGIGRTDLSQVYHKPYVEKTPIVYESSKNLTSDGELIERLKELCPAEIIEMEALVIYTQLNYGRYF